MNWLKQIGSDYENYALLVNGPKGKAIVFTSWNGSTVGKPALKSIRNWHPVPIYITQDKVPAKIIDKVFRKKMQLGLD
jgi:hypothetical protein